MSKKNFIISVFTILVQYYDYHLFGFLAANIAINFFPDNDVTIQLIYAYSLMSVAMLAKPLGAVILGKIGDRTGRSNSFKISLIGSASASIIIFFIPSYESLGLISAFILLICRMVVCGFITSGSDGVRIYIYEHMDESNRCLGVGITTLFTQSGSLAASMAVWFFTLEFLPDYSWRFPFLIGGILGFIVVIVMNVTNFSDAKKVQDSDDYEKFRNISLVQVLKTNWKLFFLCVILAGSIGGTNQFLLIFFGTYNFEILQTVDRSAMQSYISYAIIAYMFFGIIAGYLADRFDKYHVTILGSIVVIILSIWLCMLLQQRIFNQWLFVAIAATMPFITISSAAILKQAIPTVIRYRVFSLSHSVGSVLLSAPTSFISILLYHKTNIIWLPISYFIIMIIIMSFSLYYLNKRIIKNSLLKQ